MSSSSGSRAKTSTSATKKTTKKAAKKTAKKKTAKKAAKKKTVSKGPTPRRKRAVAAGATNDSSGRLRVRQVRSGIGCAARVRRTLTALGLKHHQDEVVVVDNPAIQGMLRRVHHLVRVTSEGS